MVVGPIFEVQCDVHRLSGRSHRQVYFVHPSAIHQTLLTVRAKVAKVDHDGHAVPDRMRNHGTIVEI